MPHKIEKIVYTFKELLEAVNDPESNVTKRTVENARQWLQSAATDDAFWHKDMISQWKEALDQIGFEDAKINFSGFWCQGDGASFTANINLRKLIDFLSSSGDFDNAGYDRVGYDRAGYDRAGYNRYGYDCDGYDRDGYNRDGYNCAGYDRAGYNRAGYNRAGYNRDGYNRDGYNRAGYDCAGVP